MPRCDESSQHYAHRRYDVLLGIDGVPLAQTELRTVSINPRREIEKIVEYKNDSGNGYTHAPVLRRICGSRRFGEESGT